MFKKITWDADWLELHGRGRLDRHFLLRGITTVRH